MFILLIGYLIKGNITLFDKFIANQNVMTSKNYVLFIHIQKFTYL